VAQLDQWCVANQIGERGEDGGQRRNWTLMTTGMLRRCRVGRVTRELGAPDLVGGSRSGVGQRPEVGVVYGVAHGTVLFLIVL
jgi:hypothetical protein